LTTVRSKAEVNGGLQSVLLLCYTISAVVVVLYWCCGYGQPDNPQIEVRKMPHEIRKGYCRHFFPDGKACERRANKKGFYCGLHDRAVIHHGLYTRKLPKLRSLINQIREEYGDRDTNLHQELELLRAMNLRVAGYLELAIQNNNSRLEMASIDLCKNLIKEIRDHVNTITQLQERRSLTLEQADLFLKQIISILLAEAGEEVTKKVALKFRQLKWPEKITEFNSSVRRLEETESVQ